MSGQHLVVMGVSGCGKSAVAERLARELGLPLVEGDSFHPDANIRKMEQGVPLTDQDRAGWLERLGVELGSHSHGAVLTCSALKRAYRDRLRAAAPQLRFVHLALSEHDAMKRVAAREGHFYPPSLVASQFLALEDPAGEPGVIAVDALLPVDTLVAQVLAGLLTPGASR